MRTSIYSALFLFILDLVLATVGSGHLLPIKELGLTYQYYQLKCPQFESIVNKKIREWVKKDETLAPALMRLHFHDCAVRGCDASILLNHEGSERSAEASKTLRGFPVIDEIKAELEEACPRIVSCADTLTAAARDATVLVGGPFWLVPYGRKDGKVSLAKEAEKVPTGHENITSLLELFQSQGLNVLDLVVLSGAHTIGRTTCSPVQPRLFSYGNKPGQSDPSLSTTYANYLKRKCRWGSEYVDLDATTPRLFDNAYYRNLQKKMGLLSTDQLLISDPRTQPLVIALASQPSVFYSQFGVSMAKLGNVQVLTEGDPNGEVRVNCNAVNR